VIGRLCPTCGDLVDDESHGCATPKEQRAAVYGSTRWRQWTRPIVIARDGGVCQRCGDRGTIVDHLMPVLMLIALGRDPFDPAECQLLCHPCSGLKDGGHRRPPRPPSPVGLL
jgi:5-methylcytosine-specific restriction endonuclease McrA